MEEEQAKLVEYLKCFDGTKKSLEDCSAEIDAGLHKSVVYVTPKGKIYFEQHQQSIRNLLAKGSKVEILRMQVRDPGPGIYYKVRVSNEEDDENENESIILKSIGIFENGKLIRVLQRVMRRSSSSLLECSGEIEMD
jgi:hypothetical protein